jgi:hypothetical protein
MSTTLRVYQAFEMVVGNVPVTGGSRSKPVEMTVAGLPLELPKSLGPELTWNAWLGSDGPISDFDFLWIESDKDITIELMCDANDGVGTVVFAKEIKANEPWSILHDDAMANYTANFAAGTMDVIDRIRVRNRSVTDTAVIRLVLVT